MKPSWPRFVFVPVRYHLSELCFSQAWVPCKRITAPDPLGDCVRPTPVYRHVYPTHTRKASNVLLTGDAILPSADDEHEPAVQLPIWSVLVYMLLVETLDIDDEALRQIFGLVVPMEDPDLGSKIDARGFRCSVRTMEVDETWNRSGKVRILFFFFRGWC